MTKHVLKNIPISSFLSGDVITSGSEFEMLNEQECLRTNLTSSQGGLNKNKLPYVTSLQLSPVRAPYEQVIAPDMTRSNQANVKLPPTAINTALWET